MTDPAQARILITLSNGQQVSLLSEADDVEPDEAAEELLGFLHGLDRPQFVRLNNIIVHTQAISAIELDLI